MTRSECIQCGTCCTEGGPALHSEDLALVKSGKLKIACLITIRKGELVKKPNEEKPSPAHNEFVKIGGTSREWTCLFYQNGSKNCSIYDERPYACRTLKCWDTTAIEKIIEKDTLTRFDIVDQENPLFVIMEKHDKACPFPDMAVLLGAIVQGEQPDWSNYEELINDDIRLRTEAVKKFELGLKEELFYFGRPLFQSFQQLGVVISEREGKLRLNWPHD